MATYLILGLVVFLLTVVPAIVMSRPTRRSVQTYALLVMTLFVLTAIFDNLIIALGIVEYHTSKILGVYIGRAPIEDFFYPLVAAYVLPLLWGKE